MLIFILHTNNFRIKEVTGMKIKNELLILPFYFSFLLTSCSERITNPPVEESINEPVIMNKTQIYSPTEQTTWQPGSIQKIVWHMPWGVQFVQIELYRKNEYKMLISTHVPNNGNFEWNIPVVMQKSVHFRIKISAYDRPDISILSDYFLIK